jgi:hypothetical protein
MVCHRLNPVIQITAREENLNYQKQIATMIYRISLRILQESNHSNAIESCHSPLKLTKTPAQIFMPKQCSVHENWEIINMFTVPLW